MSDKYDIPLVAMNENVAFLYLCKCSSLVALEGPFIFICAYRQSARSKVYFIKYLLIVDFRLTVTSFVGF